MYCEKSCRYITKWRVSLWLELLWKWIDVYAANYTLTWRYLDRLNMYSNGFCILQDSVTRRTKIPNAGFPYCTLVKFSPDLLHFFVINWENNGNVCSKNSTKVYENISCKYIVHRIIFYIKANKKERSKNRLISKTNKKSFYVYV